MSESVREIISARFTDNVTEIILDYFYEVLDNPSIYWTDKHYDIYKAPYVSSVINADSYIRVKKSLVGDCGPVSDANIDCSEMSKNAHVLFICCSSRHARFINIPPHINQLIIIKDIYMDILPVMIPRTVKHLYVSGELDVIIPDKSMLESAEFDNRAVIKHIEQTKNSDNFELTILGFVQRSSDTAICTKKYYWPKTLRSLDFKNRLSDHKLSIYDNQNVRIESPCFDYTVEKYNDKKDLHHTEICGNRRCVTFGFR